MLGVLPAGALWATHFLRHRNLPALVLSHALLGIVAMSAVGPGPLLDLRVGPPAWERLRELRCEPKAPSGHRAGFTKDSLHPFAEVRRRQRVGVFVPTRPGVGGDPHQFHARVRSRQLVELAN